MDDTEFAAPEYASFLVRLWRRAGPAPGDASSRWQGEVEHIQSGQRWVFGSPSELWQFIGQQMVENSQQAQDGLETS